MTAFQWIFLVFLATMFFGSIGLGLYLKRQDEKRDREMIEAGKKIHRERTQD